MKGNGQSASWRATGNGDRAGTRRRRVRIGVEGGDPEFRIPNPEPRSDIRHPTSDIGIFGGTFDPIHLGHIHAALQVLERKSLDRVVLVPAGQPPHKPDAPLTPARHRLRMCRLAIRGHPRLEVSTLEIERSGPSYTIDTIRSYQGQGNVLLMMGSDSFAQIRTWQRYEEILAACPIVVVERPGLGREALSGQFNAEELANVEWLEVGALPVSGTEIRRRLAAGEPVSELLPPQVEDYIRRHGLYLEARAV